jgi:hypothetical protein
MSFENNSFTLDRQIYVGLLATSQGEVARGRTYVDKQGEYASTYSPWLSLAKGEARASRGHWISTHALLSTNNG